MNVRITADARTILIGLLLIGLLIGNSFTPVSAQESLKTEPFKTEGRDSYAQRMLPDGKWGPRLHPDRPAPVTDYTPSKARGQIGVSPLAISSPDKFGYTWDDGVAYSWYDARTNGSLTGLTGDDSYAGPYSLGFTFKFYENNYSSIYFNTNGLISLGSSIYSFSNTYLPSVAFPNNIIAPFWDDLTVGGSYNPGNIYTWAGGIAPNRYFVIEWYQVTRCCGIGATDYKTFEAVLFENGNILFQYQTMNDPLDSATVGMEDDVAYTGLTYIYNSSGITSNKAVKITRPSASARIKIFPYYYGSLSRPNEETSYAIDIRNNGDTGSDTYDLTVADILGWAVHFYKANGSTPLSDTDSDGIVDTGAVAQGSTTKVIVKIQASSYAGVGDKNTSLIDGCSSKNPSRCETVQIDTGIPAPFAQIMLDDADQAPSIAVASINNRKRVTVGSNYGYYPAIAETAAHTLATAWVSDRCLDSQCNVYVEEISYAFLGQSGEPLRSIQKLADHSSTPTPIYDVMPVLASTANGYTGIAWMRIREDPASGDYNYNIFLAIFDSAGNLISGPTNLTNNNAWGSGDLDVPEFYSPAISATSNNRLIISWERWLPTGSGALYDIYLAVYGSTGSVVKSATKMTASVADSIYYYLPNVYGLKNGQVVLGYTGTDPAQSYAEVIMFSVLDNSGNVLNAQESLAWEGWTVDIAEFANGDVLMAWTEVNGIAYSVLESLSYVETQAYIYSNPITFYMDSYVSLAADEAGNASLAWMESNGNVRRALYYAMINQNGPLYGPMIGQTAGLAWYNGYYIESNLRGYGITSYHFDPIVFLAALKRDTSGGSYAPACSVGNNYCEENDNLASAYGPLAPGVFYQAYPDDADDYYWVTLAQTGNINIRLENYTATGDLAIYTESGTLIDYWGTGGSTMELNLTNRPAGKYLVRVYTSAGYNNSNLYRLRVNY